MSKSSKEQIKNKLKNPVYCNLLYQINTQEISSMNLSKICKKSYPTIYDQMIQLAEDGYVNCKRHPTNLKNITLYQVAWKKIVKGFILYLQEKARRYEEYLFQWKKQSYFAKTQFGLNYLMNVKKGLTPFQQLKKTKKVESLIRNVFLESFFKRTFERLAKENINDRLTVQALFDYITSQSYIEDKYSLEEHKTIIAYSSVFDKFGFIKNKLDAYRQSKTILNTLKSNNDFFFHCLTKEERELFISELERSFPSKKIWQDMCDYVYLLPHIIDEINKNRVFDSAFMSPDSFKYTGLESYYDVESKVMKLALKRSGKIHKKEHKYWLRKLKSLSNIDREHLAKG